MDGDVKGEVGQDTDPGLSEDSLPLLGTSFRWGGKPRHPQTELRSVHKGTPSSQVPSE